jgi:hypothetical protein
MKTCVIRFHCCWRHKFAIKSIVVVTLIIVTLLPVLTSTIHTERTVVFPLQQWLSCYVVPTLPPLFQLLSATIHSLFLQRLAFLRAVYLPVIHLIPSVSELKDRSSDYYGISFWTTHWVVRSPVCARPFPARLNSTVRPDGRTGTLSVWNRNSYWQCEVYNKTACNGSAGRSWLAGSICPNQ